MKGENKIEIKINKEVRAYQESVVLGLSMRQFICSVLAVGVAVGIYFLTKDKLHKEVVSWLCILSAVPIAATGFIKYNGLTFEKFVAKWIQSEIRNPKQLVFKADNIYKTAMTDYFSNKQRKKLNHKTIQVETTVKQEDITKLVYKIVKAKADRIGYAKIRIKEISKILNIENKRIKTSLLELEDQKKLVPYKRGFYLLSKQEQEGMFID